VRGETGERRSGPLRSGYAAFAVGLLAPEGSR
jgi:hypothetical protein